MLTLNIVFQEHDGALRFRAEGIPDAATPLENATARVLASFLEREFNLFYATAKRALTHGVVAARDPDSSSAKDDAPASSGPQEPTAPEPPSPLPPPELFDQPGD